MLSFREGLWFYYPHTAMSSVKKHLEGEKLGSYIYGPAIYLYIYTEIVDYELWQFETSTQKPLH